jgi:cytochrome c biogenesis protein CcmG/thiol:disulfide interchange protein DsbE
MKKFLYLIFFTILLVITIIATYKISNNSPKTAPSLEEGQSDTAFFRVNITLPEFLFNDIFSNDQNFSKKDLEGKYSIINFFASWCTTCHAEHQILLSLSEEKIIDIYGIAWRDVDENARQYLEENGNPFTKVVSDGNGLFTKLANIQAVPETWIIDKKGDVVMRFRGNLQEFTIKEIKDFLNKNK